MDARSEIMIALVTPVGAPADEVTGGLCSRLKRVRYTPVLLRLSESFQDVAELAADLRETPEDERLASYMEAGTKLREVAERGDVVAGLALAKLVMCRVAITDAADQPALGHTFVLRSLKHDEELATLRQIYRDQLVVIAVLAERHERVRRVAAAIARSRGEPKPDMQATKAEELVSRDEKELGRRLGQNVGKTIPEADYFLDASDIGRLDAGLDRLMELLFGHPVVTPSRDEYGMFHAQAAAYRSSALGRQVGAVIMSPQGDLVADGTNEAPRAGGGHYWAGDLPDGRDWARGYDQNDRSKEVLAREIVRAFHGAGWFAPEYAGMAFSDMVRGALAGPLASTWLDNLTEFGRDVHAEMSAITSAARRGVSVRGCTLYTTTFPCHNCAKHIVAAGIARVVYREPYAKSFARDFHPDAIDVEHYATAACGDTIPFQPFIGVAPRRFAAWFEMGIRKRDDGSAVAWEPTESGPRLGAMVPGYLQAERDLVDEITGTLKGKGYSWRG